MQSNLLSTFALLLLGYFSHEVAANSGYIASCNSPSLLAPTSNVPHWDLVANCEIAPGQIYDLAVVVNLGSCFGNSNGKLVGQLKGSFGTSCKDIGLEDTTVLHANCANDEGTYVATSIDTNNWIGNAGGHLYCFNQNGES
ncbi:hypothetical protein N7478_008702 [Penicillium angulare]|uniref:uncharacterized protein n=1 Tax=Penicillium angulare TaxID=116970 RepID=UPI0025415B29|nr:uncharacterized protein N7478_008702 [Penicillium angulare]KAJ5273577.1 hypothetical protein N7478_008702 [Penicillium angulare]